MDKDNRNRITLNFSIENIMCYEDALNKYGKPYKKVWIMIPDGNPIDEGSKRVFWIPDWLINEDKFSDSRRYAHLDTDRLIAVYVARGLGETLEIDLELQHLSPAEDIVEKFRQFDRRSSGSVKRRFEAADPNEGDKEKK